MELSSPGSRGHLAEKLLPHVVGLAESAVCIPHFSTDFTKASTHGLTGTASCMFCTPSWQAVWCWSGVYSTRQEEIQMTKPGTTRS